MAALGLSPNDGRDPSFEIFTPPYVGNKERPVLNGFNKSTEVDPSTGSPMTTQFNLGDQISLSMGKDYGAQLDSITIIRHTVMTHLIDGDQRSVVIPKSAISSDGNNLNFALPKQKAVLPQGAYMVFVRIKDSKGNILPSQGASFMLKHS